MRRDSILTIERPQPTLLCPDCGSPRLAYELRDSNEYAPDRRDYGSWIVCRDCGGEWPEPEPTGTVAR